MRRKRKYPTEEERKQGPEYPDLGQRVARYRKIPRDKMTPEEREEYGYALEDAIRRLQHQELMGALPAAHGSPSASRTWFNDNSKGQIGKAIREQQRNALQQAVEKERRDRPDAEWERLYNEAMEAKWQPGFTTYRGPE